MDPQIIGLIGTTIGVTGVILGALVNGRGLAFTQATKLMERISAERDAAYEQSETLRASSETAWRRLELEREFSSEAIAWGEAGGKYPPGPPKRQLGQSTPTK